VPEGREIPRPSSLLDSLLRLRRDIVGGDHLIFLRVREVAAILLTWGAVEDPESLEVPFPDEADKGDHWIQIQVAVVETTVIGRRVVEVALRISLSPGQGGKCVISCRRYVLGQNRVVVDQYVRDGVKLELSAPAFASLSELTTEMRTLFQARMLS
jgi:hypothetical protein